MEDDLPKRGKTCQTDDDEQCMKVRWLRLSIHAELDQVREARGESQQDLTVELESSTVMADSVAPSITEEAEKEAKEVMAALKETARDSAQGFSDEPMQDSELWWDTYDRDDQYDDEWYDAEDDGLGVGETSPDT